MAPADQRFTHAVVTTSLALGACSVFWFFCFFFILWTAENDAETPSRWLGEGQEPSLMTAECRGAVCLSAGVSQCFLLTVLLRVMFTGLSHVFPFSSFYWVSRAFCAALVSGGPRPLIAFRHSGACVRVRRVGFGACWGIVAVGLPLNMKQCMFQGRKTRNSNQLTHVINIRLLCLPTRN